MADIITIKSKTLSSADGVEVTITNNYVSRIINGILFVNRVTTDDAGNTTETAVMEQPWRCHPDGSRSDWKNDDDAAEWLESVKDYML